MVPNMLQTGYGPRILKIEEIEAVFVSVYKEVILGTTLFLKRRFSGTNLEELKVGKMDTDRVKVERLRGHENWSEWQFVMKTLLDGDDLLDMCEGSRRKPEEAGDAENK